MRLTLLSIATLVGLSGGTSASGQDPGSAASIYGAPQQTAQLP